MRLLFILPEWGEVAGGIATYYRHLVPALRQAGHEVDLRIGSAYTQRDEPPTHSTERWLTAAAVERYLDRFAHLQPLAHLQRHLAAAWALRDMDSNQDYDLVECCDWGLSFVPWLDSSSRVVVRLHASLGQIARHEKLPGQAAFASATGLLEQAALARVDGLATYSSTNADYWRARLGRDVAMLRPAYPVEDNQPGAGRPMASGRIQSWKGVEILCQALQQVSGVRVDWYGKDMPTQSAGRTLSMAGLLGRRYPNVWGRQLIPHSAITPVELARRRGQARFVIVPSGWDVFNFTVVEAMAMGVPALVSRGAGASELIQSGHNGLLFEPGDVEGLAAGLRELAAMSPEQLLSVGHAGRETVRQELNINVSAKAHLEHYRQVCAQPARAPQPELYATLLKGFTGAGETADLLHSISIRALGKMLVQKIARRLGPGQ